MKTLPSLLSAVVLFCGSILSTFATTVETVKFCTDDNDGSDCTANVAAAQAAGWTYNAVNTTKQAQGKYSFPAKFNSGCYVTSPTYSGEYVTSVVLNSLVSALARTAKVTPYDAEGVPGTVQVLSLSKASTREDVTFTFPLSDHVSSFKIEFTASGASNAYVYYATVTTEPPPPNQTPVYVEDSAPVCAPANPRVGAAFIADVADCFSDPDGDTLSFSSTLGTVDGSVISIPAQEESPVVFTVTASDGDLSASHEFSIALSSASAPTLDLSEDSLSCVAGEEVSVTVTATSPAATPVLSLVSSPGTLSTPVESESDGVYQSVATYTYTPAGAGSEAIVFLAADPDDASLNDSATLTLSIGLAAPANVAVSDAARTTATLSADAVTGATSYDISLSGYEVTPDFVFFNENFDDNRTGKADTTDISGQLNNLFSSTGWTGSKNYWKACPDNEAVAGDGGVNCFQIGTGSAAGYAVSPALSATDGLYVAADLKALEKGITITFETIGADDVVRDALSLSLTQGSGFRFDSSNMGGEAYALSVLPGDRLRISTTKRVLVDNLVVWGTSSVLKDSSTQTVTEFPATLTDLEPGCSYTATVVAKSGDITSAPSSAVTFATPVANLPPALTVTPDDVPNAMIGQPVTIAVSATDPEEGVVTLAMTDGPDGATFDASTGAFSWTPSAVGDYSVTFTATDDDATDPETVSATVAIVVYALPEPTFTIGEPVVDGAASVMGTKTLSFTVSAAVETDPVAVTMTWSDLESDNAPLFVDGVFTWTPADAQAGEYTASFLANGYTETVTITVEARPELKAVWPAASDIDWNTFSLTWDTTQPRDTGVYGLRVWRGSDRMESSGVEEEAFNSLPTLPAGWAFAGVESGYQNDQYKLRFDATGDTVSTKLYPRAVTALSFRVQRYSEEGSTFTVYASKGGVEESDWTQVMEIADIASQAYTLEDELAGKGYRRFKWVYAKSKGNVAFGSVRATYAGAGTKWVVGSQEEPATVTVEDLPKVLTGLAGGWDYFVQVTVNGDGGETLVNSPFLRVSTPKAPQATMILVR